MVSALATMSRSRFKRQQHSNLLRLKTEESSGTRSQTSLTGLLSWSCSTGLLNQVCLTVHLCLPSTLAAWTPEPDQSLNFAVGSAFDPVPPWRGWGCWEVRKARREGSKMILNLCSFGKSISNWLRMFVKNSIYKLCRRVSVYNNVYWFNNCLLIACCLLAINLSA